MIENNRNRIDTYTGRDYQPRSTKSDGETANYVARYNRFSFDAIFET